MSIADRRAQFTERVIRQTYLEMLAEMPAGKISVTALCKRADINRSTFYLHYQDCAELLETLGAELAERMCAQIADMFAGDKAMHLGMVAMMNPAFLQNADDRNVFLSEGSHCAERIVAWAKETTLESWRGRSHLTDNQICLLFTYITNGCLALTKAANSGELNLTAEEDFQLVFKMITEGLHSVIEKLP